MGISNIASNLRPGICTSTTRPTTPYEGQVIYETDTNRVLVWDNAAWVDPSTGETGRSGLVVMTPTSVSGSGVSLSGSTVSVSTASSATINGVFTSDFDFYQIRMFILSSNSQQQITGQFTIDGTATASNYTIQSLDAYSTTIAAALVSSQTSFSVENTTTSIYAPFIIDVFYPNNNTTTHILSRNHNYNAFPDMLSFRGVRHTSSSQFDGIRFAIGAGTFSGTIQIHGVNK